MKEEFLKAFGEYAGIPEDVRITSVREETQSSGYCETCYYEERVTIVRGTRADGFHFEEKVYANLADFVNSL